MVLLAMVFDWNTTSIGLEWTIRSLEVQNLFAFFLLLTPPHGLGEEGMKGERMVRALV